jgi:antitoxin component of MazEF toxin-antitoxin module
MTTRIVRDGNTLKVEIPEEVLAQSALPVGEPLEWVSNGSGGISLVRQSDHTETRKRRTLEDILEGIPEGAVMEEIDWGPPRGTEIW